MLLVTSKGYATLADTSKAVMPPGLTDTNRIVTRRVSPEKESSTFADPKLKYQRKADKESHSSEGFFDTMWRKIFGTVDSKTTSKTSSFIFWTIVIGSGLVMLWYFYRSEISALTRVKPKNTAFNFTDITEDLNEINFDKRIAEALADRDYRLAIRWLYLKMLFGLDKKNHIRFSPSKTNIDYGYEISSREIKTDFMQLSRVYEYVWYGQFDLGEVRYMGHEEKFRDFEKRISV